MAWIDTPWTDERRAKHSAAQLAWRAERVPRDQIKRVADLGAQVGKCACGATVVPSCDDAPPIVCSNCRAARVERIIAARKMAAD